MSSLPESAWLERRYVRCGKPNCRCLKGPGHGPYAYLSRRQAGRIVRRYVKASEVALTMRALDQQRSDRQEQRELDRTIRAAIRHSGELLAQMNGRYGYVRYRAKPAYATFRDILPKSLRMP